MSKSIQTSKFPVADATIELVCEEAEIDEQWSFVKKSNQRWIWYAVEHSTNAIIVYVFGRRKDIVFKELKTLLEPFKIKRFFTDDCFLHQVILALCI